jgi:pSer/pThr/pTyr-binding forkhead associated (FHA) protein
MKVRLVHPAVGRIALRLAPGQSVVLGRGRGPSDIGIGWDPRVSRRHARIQEKGGELWFEDLGSRNGSWMGEERIVEATSIAPGSVVVIGETLLFVLVEGDEDASTVADTEERPYTPEEDACIEAAHRAGTLDLAPAPESAPPALAQPRLQDGVVRISSADRAAFRELWRRDLSRQRLFVEGRSAPELFAQLAIRVEGPAGSVELRGEVVHVVDARAALKSGGRPGFGLHVLDLDVAKRRRIQSHADGFPFLGSTAEDGATEAGEDLAPLLAEAKRILERAEQGDFYGALDLSPVARPDLIDRTALEAVRRLRAAARLAPPPQATRLQTASDVLARVHRVLGHEMSRLEYDFRVGHVRSQERMRDSQAGTGPSAAALSRAWHRAYPERVGRAAALTREAFRARGRGDLDAAVETAHAALALNPFFEELRACAKTWSREPGRTWGVGGERPSRGED